MISLCKKGKSKRQFDAILNNIILAFHLRPCLIWPFCLNNLVYFLVHSSSFILRRSEQGILANLLGPTLTQTKLFGKKKSENGCLIHLGFVLHYCFIDFSVLRSGLRDNQILMSKRRKGCRGNATAQTMQTSPRSHFKSTPDKKYWHLGNTK